MVITFRLKVRPPTSCLISLDFFAADTIFYQLYPNNFIGPLISVLIATRVQSNVSLRMNCNNLSNSQNVIRLRNVSVFCMLYFTS